MFLNYSALESGKLVLHLRENDLRDCLSELAKRWQEAFYRKHVRLETRFDDKLPLLKFDYQKVQQTVANLLDNALKTHSGGRQRDPHAESHFWERRAAEEVPATERRRDRVPRPNSVKVEVSDTGEGIAAEHHQEIFEDFVRVDRTSSGMVWACNRQAAGAGASRQDLVDSEPWLGCRFTFLLPTGQSVAGRIKFRDRSLMAEKERILVVDDEPSIRKYLQTLLEVDGYAVETVSSGKKLWSGWARATDPTSSSSTS